MRSCSVCKIADRAHIDEESHCNCQGVEVLGHSEDCQKVQHFVQRDIRLQDTALTKKQRLQGWVERPQGFRGKPAIQRFICVPCIRKIEEVADIAAYKKKRAEELDGSKTETMYQILSY